MQSTTTVNRLSEVANLYNKQYGMMVLPVEWISHREDCKTDLSYKTPAIDEHSNFFRNSWMDMMCLIQIMIGGNQQVYAYVLAVTIIGVLQLSLTNFTTMMLMSNQYTTRYWIYFPYLKIMLGLYGHQIWNPCL